MPDKFITRLSCFTVSLVFSTICFGQSIDSAIQKYGNNFQPEKAYLHFDKSSYSPGETIWFKAYLMQGLLPELDTKTIYVDWIDDKGNVLSHSVSPLIEAVTNGQFDIPENFAGNFVHVRAYTKWMLNFDTAFIFHRDIRVLGNNNLSAKITMTPGVTSLQMFPEGGDMVMGVVNRVAFKANDQYGIPATIRGVIMDSKGSIVDSIRSIHDGMGSFALIPQTGLTYSAKWKDEKGYSSTTDLPAAKPDGIAMQVISNGGKRIITIYSGSEVTDNMKVLHLVGTMNSNMVFKTDVQVNPSATVGRVLPVDNLPSGILTITVFDANWKAVAERIIFVNNYEYAFETSMEVKYWGLSKRKRNEIEITVPDSLGQTNLSVSVTDVSIEKDTSDNIISHFLLSSDIKGRVYNPAYYFSGKSEKLSRDLDLVMLTNGWRRFKWEDVTAGKLPAINYARDSNYLTLSGQVFGVTKSQLSGKESIVLIIKERDSGSRMLIVPINRDATFADPNVVIFDSVKVYYSLKSKMFSQAEAKFMTQRFPAPNYQALSKTFLTASPFLDTAGMHRHMKMAAEAARLNALDRGKIMETVTVKARQKPTVQVLDEKYASGFFKGGDGYQFDLINDPLAVSSGNIFSYLQGKVAGLQISQAGGQTSLNWRGGAPALYIDEMSSDVEMLEGIPVTDVAYIKVFRPPFTGGFGGSNGAIAIYTKRGDDAKTTSGGLTSNTVVGYSPIRQFYSPNYDRYDARNERPDVRTTLYWNPQVMAGEKHNKILLSFYNNDISSSFRVVIEGMSRDGLLTHYEQVME